MIACPNCGAWNKSGSSVCRMCATSLESVAEPAVAARQGEDRKVVGATVRKEKGEEGLQVKQEGIACPECNTVNEVGWSFCQQCGKKLPDSSAPSDLQARQALKTVRDQPAVTDPTLARSVKTVEEEAPALREESPAEEPSRTPRVERPVEQKLEAAETQTVVAPKVEPPVSAPPPPATEHVRTVSGVLCSQCGETSSAGSVFCANCGAPIKFGKTMAMSSEPVTSRARLHLVMEGGQPGEIYELADETVIGRTHGRITFPHDGFMSGRHARIVRRGGSFVLTDEGSRNGTFVKISGEIELEPGDMILIGKQLFRFEE